MINLTLQKYKGTGMPALRAGKIGFSILLGSFIFHPGAYAASPESSVPQDVDSVKVRQLRELVVEGKDAWIEGDKAVFLPSKRDKKLSNSVSSLLERMKIPTLIVEGGKITNIGGKNVTVFINGIRANEVDYSTFWPKQALRVEYMENPSDPRFEGVDCAVNFVMKELETGGVAKIYADQTFRNEGDYFAAAKLEHGKMTYGLMADASYSRDHLLSGSGTETYENLYYEGIHYDKIEKSYEEKRYNRSDNVDIALNARYISDKTNMTHTAAFRWNRNPGSGYSSSQQWSPQVLHSESATQKSGGHSLSPQISGNYTFTLPENWRLYANWKYSYARNHGKYLYQAEGEEAIANHTMEDVNSISGGATLFWQPSGKFATSLQLSSWMDFFDTHYTGSTDEISRQDRGGTIGSLYLWWRPASTFAISVKPGITIDYWRTDGLASESSVSPRGELTAAWYPSGKFNANTGVNYQRTNPSASASSDVILRQTELLWSSGNPYLNGYDNWYSYMSMMWLPAKWIRLSNYFFWRHTDNDIIPVYRPASIEMGGLVQTNVNGAPLDCLGWDFVATFPSFINNIFSLSLQPTYRYYVAHGEFAGKSGWFRMRGNLGADIGDFHVGIVYGAGEKYLSAAGTQKFRTSGQWDITASYGTGDWYFDIRLNDVFNSRKKGWIWTEAASLRSWERTSDIGRSLNISVSYTFGFGKKVDKEIKVSGPDEIKTGVIKM